MRILSLVSPFSRQALLPACGVMGATLVPVTVLLPTPQAEPDPDVVVGDPDFLSEPPIAAALKAYATSHPHVGIVVMGALTPTLATLVHEIGSTRAIAVALPAFDRPATLQRFLDDAILLAVRERVLWHLAPNLTILPTPLAQTVRAVFRDPKLARGTMETVAVYANVDRRTVYRWLNRAGFAQPKDLLRAARLLHALPLIRHRGQSLHVISGRLEYSEYAQFQIHTQRVFGTTPRKLRFHVPVETLAATAAQRLVLHQSGRSSSRSMVSRLPNEP